MLKHGGVTERILGGYFQVYNTLGYGFFESVYQKALTIELRKRGLKVKPRAPITVYYDGEVVGTYYADLLVDNCVLVELKAVEALADAHHAQLNNYLRATEIEVGLLLNFGPKPETKRKVFDNNKKILLGSDPF